MKRRSFFKKSAGAAVAASLMPLGAEAVASKQDIGVRTSDKWHHLGKGKSEIPNRKKKVQYEVVVIGAGIAGICAAVTAARTGAKTVLINDRSVLGGNASSEIRVTVNGVQWLKNEHRMERETGVIEEFQLENWYYNPQESYPVWDHVLYDYVTRQPNLDVMLNTQALEAYMDGSQIKAARCWQMTTETEYTVEGQQFIDCSGDGLLAATAGAEYRTGREARAEFNESFAPEVADGWQMGATLMMITKDMGRPVPYYPPSFTIKYEAEKAHDRKIKQIKEGYWWVELGSDDDIIADQEFNRHKLMGYMHGVWDYIKNSGNFPESENIVLDWVGSVPGRRESRRFMGDHILTQKEMENYKHFPDAVGYGGWSLDEHNPGGIENLSEPPSYFHDKFKQVYEIPFKSLYSKNITNLLFAGRNVSVTHIALSSTRVQATCATMGMAVGTAAALGVQKGVTPRQIANEHIDELQEQLLRDDAYIPNRPARDSKDLARKADVLFASSTTSGDVKLLIDGVSRDEIGKIHHWQSRGLDAEVRLEWKKPVSISSIELKGDTNLQRAIHMHKNPLKNKDQVLGMPPELIKACSAQVRVKGKWVDVASVSNNLTRLVKMKIDPVKTTAVRILLKETWGAENIKLFEIRCYS
ncbi:FAD-dependent oxidoreductase [Reichenbachiella carrageenanivorans]|uniref:FAD-dependent oxidoreductase n=1 Tax=Reichenbachiella carrageenanivorans TaxID=2979869 RepID=A0ABY6D4K1_9BACT|nr:FAD-dependent oxidoreductase [Reichenbachiella carrageenanivorans]UXX81085.1 FAD-dependent oxidoreductase [Reichenbachiella carrageenanivorans]